MTYTRTHVYVTFANPHLACGECRAPVPRWHDPERCGCKETGFQNIPCGHQADTIDLCPSWGPVDGCRCPEPHRSDGEK